MLWSSLSLPSVSNHAYAITQFITICPFSQVPRSPYLMLPFQGGDQSPLLPIRVGSPDWGLALWPYLTLWSFLVSPVGVWLSRVRMPVQKRTWNTIRWCSSSFVSGPLHSNPSPAEPPVWLSWLESHRGLQKCCRNQYSRNQAPHLESWRTQVYSLVGPEESTLQALCTKQRGYRVFIHGQK